MSARLVLAVLLIGVLSSLLGCSDSSESDPRFATFVVLGEGLTAGMGDFGLSEESQRRSFPIRIARLVGADFSQPLLQSPGVGDVPGFPKLPVQIPTAFQTTVLSTFPPVAPYSHIAIPGFTLTDALNMRPVSPLVHRNDAKQTLTNLILGLPDLLQDDGTSLPTQLEYAQQLNPTFVIVGFGYTEVLEAAINADPNQLPDITTFSSNYAQLLATLRQNGADVLVINIPDPIDSAYFSSLTSAARVVKTDAAFLTQTYGLQAEDQITVPGLIEIGNQLLSQNIQAPLSGGAVLAAATASAVSQHVIALNAAINSVAAQNNALVYDLHAFFRKWGEGVTVGSKQLTSDYLGGLFSLNGSYPTATGHTLIANEILALINEEFGTFFPPVSVETALADDPLQVFESPQAVVNSTAAASRGSGIAAAADDRFGVLFQAANDDSGTGVPGCGLPPVEALNQPLQLPPGLEQTLPLNSMVSYFGDAIRAVNCANPGDKELGTCGEQFFGGLAMTDTHLSGQVRITFSEPVNNITRFEVVFPEPLVGNDGILTAPQLFRLPNRQQLVQNFPGRISSGRLNLETGIVTHLEFNLSFLNTALASLLNVNPSFPNVAIQFPNEDDADRGSIAVHFEQRPDGLLDFSFYGTTYVPLGRVLVDQQAPHRFPLPFCDAALNCTSIAANGTALHPHIYISTKASEEPECGAACPTVAANTLQEFIHFVHNTSFGDDFGLFIPELGIREDGSPAARGRSHLMGRLQVQFGEPFGDHIPVAFTALSPGGFLFEFPPNFLDGSFADQGARLPRGLIGFDSVLQWPLQQYDQFNLSLSDDPFDIGVGVLNLKTGRLLTNLLHRGFIGQDLIFALLILEPRTPTAGFCFRGPAVFEAGVNGQTVFRYDGEVTVPYPAGFAFPAPDLETTLFNERDGVLDPFRRIQAMHASETPQVVMTGAEAGLVAVTGQQFSYSYSIPCDPASQDAFFEYTNATLGGTFQMTGLTWVSCTNSRNSQAGPGDADAVTFTGFGTWSLDPSGASHVAAVHISTAPDAPYVGVQIDGGLTASTDTKPANVEETLP